MDIKEVRRLNAEHLADKHSRKVFADKMGLSDTNYINQIVKGHTKIGDNKARHIERCFKLPAFWMDSAHPALWLDGSQAEMTEDYIRNQLLKGMGVKSLSLIIETASRMITAASKDDD